jgi:hypothetical protein
VVKNLIGLLIVKCSKHGKQKIILTLKTLHGSWLIQSLAQILSVESLLRRINFHFCWKCMKPWEGHDDYFNCKFEEEITKSKDFKAKKS